ncbi:MAG: DNA polymerase III subunit beta [Opitutales bacterium]|nr:DNA polymerase III subunit beta [Opitutales bacterium]
MKFKTNQSQFLSALNQVASVVGAHAALPILNNILIEACDGFLKLTTTSIDLRICCKVKADVMEEGKITLPAKILKEMLGGFQDEVFFNQKNPTRVEISSGNSLFTLNGIDAGEFPLAPSFNDEIAFEFEKSLISSMLNSVAYAQSTDENRYVLNGVYFKIDGNTISVVATDGKRLAVCKKNCEISVDNPIKFILPAKTVFELQKQLVGDGKMTFSFSSHLIAFKIDAADSEKTGIIDKITLVSKLVDGTYPKYEGVIPKDSSKLIEIDRDEMFYAISQAKSVISDRNNNSVTFDIRENLIDVTAVSSEFGEASVKLDVRYSGDEVKISFNPNFILDLMKALPQNKLIFEFKDQMSPGVIKTKEDDFICVIMPQRQ